MFLGLMYVHVRTCGYVCMCGYIHAHSDAWVYACICVCLCECRYVTDVMCAYVYMCMQMYACMDVSKLCVYVCV